MSTPLSRQPQRPISGMKPYEGVSSLNIFFVMTREDYDPDVGPTEAWCDVRFIDQHGKPKLIKVNPDELATLLPNPVEQHFNEQGPLKGIYLNPELVRSVAASATPTDEMRYKVAFNLNPVAFGQPAENELIVDFHVDSTKFSSGMDFVRRLMQRYGDKHGMDTVTEIGTPDQSIKEVVLAPFHPRRAAPALTPA